ncbi:MAG: ATP-binding cassette domain-containing protein, partial [Myxococcota bacterium]
MPSPLIQTRALTRDYPMGESVVRALDAVDLRIDEGEFVALVGTSGSGKTTLLSLLGCLDQPSSGSYELAGREVATLSSDELAQVRNARIGCREPVDEVERLEHEADACVAHLGELVGRQGGH